VTETAEVTQFPQRGIRCVSLRHINKGALIAFCDLQCEAWSLLLHDRKWSCEAWSLLLHDCKWFSKNGNEWISLPSTSYTNRDGKTVYKDLIEFTDKEVSERFNRAALQAVKTYRET
jgi:hypothetical protein